MCYCEYQGSKAHYFLMKFLQKRVFNARFTVHAKMMRSAIAAHCARVALLTKSGPRASHLRVIRGAFARLHASALRVVLGTTLRTR